MFLNLTVSVCHVVIHAQEVKSLCCPKLKQTITFDQVMVGSLTKVKLTLQENEQVTLQRVSQGVWTVWMPI